MIHLATLLTGPRLRQHPVGAHLRVDGGPLPLPRLRQGLQGGERVGLGAHARPAEDPAQPESAGKAARRATAKGMRNEGKLAYRVACQV